MARSTFKASAQRGMRVYAVAGECNPTQECFRRTPGVGCFRNKESQPVVRRANLKSLIELELQQLKSEYFCCYLERAAATH